MNAPMILLAALIGYLLGSVNASLVIGKVIYKTDIRQYGSGNAGATNALRTFGRRAALMAVAGDALKGILACLVGSMLAGDSDISGATVHVGACVGGMTAVIGHNWPVYFGFRGGKGVMTSFAVIAFLAPLSALISAVLFLVLVAIWKMVSLGSLAGAISFPVAAACLGEPPLLVLTGVFLALLIVIRHIPNIRRMLDGTEKKLGQGKTA